VKHRIFNPTTNTNTNTNNRKKNIMIKKYYFNNELAALERSRYWNNFLDGALTGTFVSLSAAVILLLFTTQTTQPKDEGYNIKEDTGYNIKEDTTPPEIRLNVRPVDMTPAVQPVNQFAF